MKVNINHSLKNSRHEMFGEQNDLKRDVIEFRKEFRNKRLKYFRGKGCTRSNTRVNKHNR